jgi:hypothetical protein
LLLVSRQVAWCHSLGLLLVSRQVAWCHSLGLRGFCGFDPGRVAQFGEGDVERLMGEDSGIVRHRGKILSAINNAR